MIKKIIKAINWRVKKFINVKVKGKKSTIPCNICGNKVFIKGPNGRLSLTNKYPWCPKCWSLERHRGLKVFWNKFDKSKFKKLDVLQFSHDPAVNPDWFNSHTITIYNGMNSLDVQNIDKPDSVYDIVLCNQVIEHVPDDKSAIRELLRITKRDGFVQIGVPYPMELEKTIDWGYPKESDHGHYRNYGRDISNLLDEIVGTELWKEIIVTDPITNAQDYIYILGHSKEYINNIFLTSNN